MMFIRALIAFIMLPGIFSLIIPHFIAYFDPWKYDNQFISGLIIISIGLSIIFICVTSFYKTGKGTLAPWDPPKKIVVKGLYRFMRNPMYLGVVVLVIGWCVFYGSPILLLYTISLAIGFHIRVVRFEEPWLKKEFGDQWEKYHKNVHRWLPRITPWSDDF